MVGKYNLERLLRKPVEPVLASEFRYSDPLITKNTLVIVISQSGETLDTMAALREAKSRGAHILSIVNVVGSSIARESDDVLGGFHYLPERDVKVLRDWLHRPFAF